MKTFKKILFIIFIVGIFGCDKDKDDKGNITYLSDTLQGEWSWIKTYTAKQGIIDNDYKSVLKIFGQNEDATINYEAYVADTLFYQGTFKFEQTQWTNAVIKLPHWNNSDAWDLDWKQKDTLCFFSGNPDDYMFYYKKIK